MRTFSSSPAALAGSVWQNRSLIRALVVREVLGRYRGSALGVLWSFFNPIFMLTVYTFVFSVVFKAKWGAGNESRTDFALALFIGLIAFNLFAECINRAPTLVLENANYVKKVVFPLETLPIVNLGAAVFHAAISLLVWIAFYLLSAGTPHASMLWLPLVLLPLVLLAAGCSWALASLGVYLRDVGHVIGLFTTSLLFLSPVFYPASALPEGLRVVFEFNPLTSIIEMLRDVLMWGHEPSPLRLGLSLLVAAAVACLGFAWFQKTRRGFADVL